MASSEGGLRHLLLDPGFWRPRLDQLSDIQRQLVQVPRDDLARPGIEVIELRLRAHDGALLRGLLARSSFHKQGSSVRLRLCANLGTCALDWRSVEEGATDVVFHHPPDRRLEDRVLDVIQVIEATALLENVDHSRVRLHSGVEPPPDEFVLADLVRSQGWISS